MCRLSISTTKPKPTPTSSSSSSSSVLLLSSIRIDHNMSSILLSSQSVVLATAMAVSGTVILLAFRLQKQTPDAGKREKKKKKRVHFAEDVMDPAGNGEEFRKNHKITMTKNSPQKFQNSASFSADNTSGGNKLTGMPANRVALYNGILRDRVVHRLGYSY